MNFLGLGFYTGSIRVLEAVNKGSIGSLGYRGFWASGSIKDLNGVWDSGFN